MWLNDDTWKQCPECGWGYARILAVGDDWQSTELRCRKCRRTYTHETGPEERLHLMPPEPPLEPRRYSVHRGHSEDGPWTSGAEVRDFEQGNRVVDRSRPERPDLWIMIAIDGTPMLRAAPLRDRDVSGKFRSK
jgi:hypothetical protein